MMMQYNETSMINSQNKNTDINTYDKWDEHPWKKLSYKQPILCNANNETVVFSWLACCGRRF